MSLRARLIVSLILVLFVSLGTGGAVAGWHAVRSVRAEMQAALDVGTQTLRNGLLEIAATGDPGPELEHLVHAFDGDRHLQAILRDAAGQERAASVLHPLAARLPNWFICLLSPSLDPARFAAGSASAIILRPDPRNEISEVWIQLRDDCIAVGLFCGMSVLLTSLVVGHALRPLRRLSLTLTALGAGDYSVRIHPSGPPELARLARGVNTLTERLQAAQARNLRLQEQLLTLQEEERADLARDLHDEIGPFLFAVQLDVAAIEQAAIGQAAGTDRAAEIRERAHAIRDAVTHMQQHVRAMLHRLRPLNPVEAGLAPALDKLVAFWRSRRPEVAFVLHTAGSDGQLAAPAMATAYRLVQESLNNAIRHGDPTRIEISLEIHPAGTLSVRVLDDGTGLAEPNQPGLGLTGMRERIEALGGTLRISPGRQGRGLAIAAFLPGTAALEDA